MPLILQTPDFKVEAHDQPHHSRENGGHVKVTPLVRYDHATDMPIESYLKMMKVVRLTGLAILSVMPARGIPVVRINYQDNGNWAYKPSLHLQPSVHVHLYVRTWGEKHPAGDPRFQAFPDALVFPPNDDGTGYYHQFQPYTQADCEAIRAEMLRLGTAESYQDLQLS